MNNIKICTLIILSFLWAGCQSGDGDAQELAALQGKASSEASIIAENANRSERAAAMEADLAQRHRFYQGIAGAYEGEVESAYGTYRIRFTIIPSLYPYRTNRVRLLEEIAADINNLYLNIQVVHWHTDSPLVANGCRVTQVHPDMARGMVTIASEGCPNLYSFSVADFVTNTQDGSLSNDSIPSSEIASQVINGQRNTIGALEGSMQPSTNALSYRFSAVRVVEAVRSHL